MGSIPPVNMGPIGMYRAKQPPKTPPNTMPTTSFENLKPNPNPISHRVIYSAEHLAAYKKAVSGPGCVCQYPFPPLSTKKAWTVVPIKTKKRKKKKILKIMYNFFRDVFESF